MELLAGAVVGTAVNVAYHHLCSAAASAARSVFIFDKICSKLADDLRLYYPYFQQALHNIDASAAPEWQQDVLRFKQKLENGASLLQECQQFQELCGFFHPLQRNRFGKQILHLREEIRRFMTDNRLPILRISQLEMRLTDSEEEDKALLHKIDGDMTQVKECMQRMEHGVPSQLTTPHIFPK